MDAASAKDQAKRQQQADCLRRHIIHSEATLRIRKDLHQYNVVFLVNIVEIFQLVIIVISWRYFSVNPKLLADDLWRRRYIYEK